MPIELFRLTKPRIAELKDLFSKTPILAEFNPFIQGIGEEFEWQFFSEIYEPSIYIVAVDTEKNELAGTLAYLFIRMISPNGTVCLTVKPEDTLINVKSLIRNKNADLLKGISEELDRETENKDLEFYWGFTKETSAFERLGYTSPFSSMQGLYVLNPMQAYEHLSSLNKANKVKQRLQIFSLSLLSYLRTLSKFKIKGKIQCKEIRTSEIDYKLLLTMVPEKSYSILPDKEFIEWRIDHNPSELGFSVLQFTNAQNEKVAYLILSKKGKSIFFIEQFFFGQKMNNAEKINIVKVTAQYLRQQKASIIRCMGFTHNSVNKKEVAILKEAGFTFLNRGIPFIFKTKNENIKPESIYLSRLNTQGTF